MKAPTLTPDSRGPVDLTPTRLQLVLAAMEREQGSGLPEITDDRDRSQDSAPVRLATPRAPVWATCGGRRQS